MRARAREIGPLAGVAIVIVAVTVATALTSTIARAQEIEDCMRASPAQAVTVCRALVDAGRADADVWTQLALSLSKSGDASAAEQAIADGLRRHPKDADLLALRARLATDRSEEEELLRATRRNTSAMALGQLRLACLTGTGSSGREACRRHLETTDADGDRIRAKLASLEQASDPPADSGPTAPAPAPLTAPTTTPDDVGRTDVADVPDTDPAPAPDPARLARRARITAIQRALNALGLPVGTADGIAGRRTVQALERFESSTGLSVGRALDESTLAALESEGVRLESAREALAASRRAAREERFDDARELLSRAESTSALLELPPGYRAELDAAADAARAANAVPVADAPTTDDTGNDRTVALVNGDAGTPDGSGTGNTAASTGATEDDPLADLLTRIGTLERRLADERTRSREDDGRLRTEVAKVLGRQ